MIKRYGRLLTASLALMGILLCTGRANVQAEGPAELSEKDLKEQSIYVPYEKLWKVFEKKGRGVFVPYEEFEKLWKAAEKATRRPEDAPPPSDFLVTEVSGEAEVIEDVVRVKARVKIELLKKGWHEVPIRLGDVAITSARMGDSAARVVFDKGTGHKLLIEKKGDQPEVHDLTLEFAKSYTKSPGRNTVTFQSPIAPLSRWSVRIPESGVKVQVHPLLAASDVPAKAGVEETVVEAFVGATPTVRVEWTPKAEGAKGLEALANARAEQEVWVEEGVLRSRVLMTYEISRTELSEFEIEVPSGQKVVNVFDQNVREWSVKGNGDTQTVSVQLFEPTRGTQKLVIELEKFGEDTRVAVPLVRALGVGRQRGVVVIKMGTGLRAEVVNRRGLLQLDSGELPARLTKGKWDFSYRYSALPFTVDLSVEKIQPRILVDSLAEVHVQPEELVVDFLAVHDVQKTGVFSLSLLVPKGYDIRDVKGASVGGASVAAVDGFHLDEAEGENAKNGRLTINLSRRASGRVGVAVKLQRALQEPALLNPTGETAGIDVLIPRANPDVVERESGRLVVYGPESLRLNPRTTSGLRVIPYRDAVNQMRSTRNSKIERPVVSFAYTDQAVSLALDAERRAPHITARQLLVARIESGVVKYTATFSFNILYSGVKFLRIDIPREAAELIRVTTPGVRRTILQGDNLPDDLAEGHVAWQLAGETEFIGSAQFRLAWEKKVEKLDIGKTVKLDVPRIVTRDVDRAWGQVVLAKAEAIDVAPAEAVKGLNPIDPGRDLMDGRTVEDAARAFEFHDEWQLGVNVTRYELKDVKATSIDRGLVRMVVTRSDMTSVQAAYRMQSARQRLVVRLPGNVDFDSQPVRINGRPVPLEQGDTGDYFIPLASQQSDQSFLLEIRYTVREAGFHLQVPEFPQDPAVQQVYLAAYVPRELSYLGKTGPWNDEMVWVLNGFRSWPRGNKTSDWLMGWVSEGTSADRSGLTSFATDGRYLLYSTLRPEAGEDGALHVRMMAQWILQSLVLALIIGIGLVLLPAHFALRSIAVGAALVTLVFSGVFMPSFVRAMVNNATVGAGFVVLVIWILWYMLITRPRDPQVQALKNARQKARLDKLRGKKSRKSPPGAPMQVDASDPKDIKASEGEKSNA
ncbi:MAG: hypothetical protein QGI24_01465 [Kiritimatiellia bacterium]|jgi:hypothetical protein|nr:hypothetical protein [Kiritimatiellia bacterium]MDP6847431.1 hypothetical protein [Kiritimatiellia bacterium]